VRKRVKRINAFGYRIHFGKDHLKNFGAVIRTSKILQDLDLSFDE